MKLECICGRIFKVRNDIRLSDELVLFTEYHLLTKVDGKPTPLGKRQWEVADVLAYAREQA